MEVDSQECKHVQTVSNSSTARSLTADHDCTTFKVIALELLFQVNQDKFKSSCVLSRQDMVTWLDGKRVPSIQVKNTCILAIH